MTDEEILSHARACRQSAVEMAYRCGTNAHLGGGLSLIDIMCVLYGDIMKASDKFVLSKGHGVLGLYAALAEFGRMPKALLQTFQQDGSALIAHPVMNDALGIESSTGSLGQGISFAVGLALAAKKKNFGYKTYVLCGNGESNEGSVWEAAMSAVHFQLDQFTLIIDNNHLQSDGPSQEIMNVSDRYVSMLEAVGFDATEVDGHDITALRKVLGKKRQSGRPCAVVANTIKGKGISFMENNNDWHHNRLTESQYESAMEELEAMD